MGQAWGHISLLRKVRRIKENTSQGKISLELLLLCAPEGYWASLSPAPAWDHMQLAVLSDLKSEAKRAVGKLSHCSFEGTCRAETFLSLSLHL